MGCCRTDIIFAGIRQPITLNVRGRLYRTHTYLLDWLTGAGCAGAAAIEPASTAGCGALMTGAGGITRAARGTALAAV